ncbi:hypothetical protein B0H11DRAFT_2390188 [Mycena galericulata]|nr:hypothetical protein B0H11DRAFT_2390188 [Mycena galericulata]
MVTAYSAPPSFPLRVGSSMSFVEKPQTNSPPSGRALAAVSLFDVARREVLFITRSITPVPICSSASANEAREDDTGGIKTVRSNQESRDSDSDTNQMVSESNVRDGDGANQTAGVLSSSLHCTTLSRSHLYSLDIRNHAPLYLSTVFFCLLQVRWLAPCTCAARSTRARSIILPVYLFCQLFLEHKWCLERRCRVNNLDTRTAYWGVVMGEKRSVRFIYFPRFWFSWETMYSKRDESYNVANAEPGRLVEFCSSIGACGWPKRISRRGDGENLKVKRKIASEQVGRGESNPGLLPHRYFKM